MVIIFYFHKIERIYNKQGQKMAEYNITKIIDGLFVSDCFVPQDALFLMGNKVIRLLGWTNYIEYHQIEEQNIFQFHLTKNEKEVKFPKWPELQKAFEFLQVIHGQMLCGLIYSETQLESSLICIMYLMYKFHWNYQTAFSFIKSKMEMFQFSDEAQEQLQIYQSTLQSQLKIKLKNITWEYDYLLKYYPSNDEESLIVNTFKNKVRKFHHLENHQQRVVKKPRIKWYDQLRPSSAKYINMNKGSRVSLNKSKLSASTNQISIFQDFSNSSKGHQLLHQSLNPKLSNIKQASQKKENAWQEDSEYLQLKELSRTNFNDKKYMTNQIRRRGSLNTHKDKTPKNTQSSINLNNINSILGIYSSNPKLSTKTKTNLSKTSAQSFLSHLKTYNKSALNLA